MKKNNKFKPKKIHQKMTTKMKFLNEPLELNQPMAVIVETTIATRTEVVNKIWAYIKKNNLQNPRNKRMILLDSKMKNMCQNRKEISMFELTKFVNQNIIGPARHL